MGVKTGDSEREADVHIEALALAQPVVEKGTVALIVAQPERLADTDTEAH